MSDSEMDGGDGDLSLADTLMIRRRGRRRRLPMYGTLGMSDDLDSMRPFLDALAATGHPVDLDDLLTPPDDSPTDD